MVLSDDPRLYGDEPVNQIGGGGSGSGGDAVSDFLSSFGLGGGAGPAAAGRGGQRLNAIRAAASLPLLAVSPSLDSSPATRMCIAQLAVTPPSARLLVLPFTTVPRWL